MCGAGLPRPRRPGWLPIKLNCVVTRGFNDDEVVDLARLSLRNDWEVRFIELMPLGSVADFQQDQVVPSAETQGPHRGRAGSARGRARATTATIRPGRTGCQARGASWALSAASASRSARGATGCG